VVEVWIWRKGVIEVHVLVGAKFERSQRSRLLPDLDLRASRVHARPRYAHPGRARFQKGVRNGIVKKLGERRLEGLVELNGIEPMTS
jgi:hypothetical protein